jgi:predicted GTPase
MADHNFSRPHFSLRKENIQKIKDHVWKKWDKVTPMMSIGVTKHSWSLKELLTHLITKISVNKRVSINFY